MKRNSANAAVCKGNNETMKKIIYLDNAATNPLDKEVLKAMLPFFKEKFGNPSSAHSLGQSAKDAIEKARKQVASMINAEPDEIIFTSGGTEANNLALKCFPSEKIVTSSIEHHAVLEVTKASGKQVEIIIVDKEGIVDTEELRQKITPNSLVSVMHVNNEIGTIQPIEEIARICKERGAFFHTDAVQSFGKLAIDVKKQGIDMLSASGHKINGPKGIGFLYIKKNLKSMLMPLLHGGGQEQGLRSGTENVAGIVGLGKAAELSKKKMKNAGKLRKLRDYFIKKILEIPNVKLNGSPEKRIFNNANFTIKDVEGEALVLMLDQAGIACSTGSACSAIGHKSSHVLKALGFSDEDIHSSARFSLGFQNTKKEIDYTAKKVEESVIKLRRLAGK
jgi:cysteine desulfurase